MEARAPENKELEQVQSFLNQQLRQGIQWCLSEEYPLAFDEKNRDNMRIIEKEGKILSHAVLKPTLIKTHWHLFKVGLIGSVVTDEKHRGQGLSKDIIESCLKSAQEQNCDFSMLWTDMFDFYQKFGFEIAGSEVALQTTKQFKAPQKNLKILNTKQVSPESILRLYNKHNLKTLRTPQDINRYLNIPNSEVYTAWSKSTNSLEAYCVVGKGADFQNYIHEWGGNVSSILSLIEKISENKKENVTIITPPQCENLIRQMKDAGANENFGILGMIKILNPMNFTKKIKKGARALGYENFVFEFREKNYYFGYGDDIYQTDSDSDIIRLVFGPLKPEQIHSFNDETLNALKEIFPIPFWVWGWDSV